MTTSSIGFLKKLAIKFLRMITPMPNPLLEMLLPLKEKTCLPKLAEASVKRGKRIELNLVNKLSTVSKMEVSVVQPHSKRLQQETYQQLKESNLEWQIQQTIKEVHKVVGPTDSSQLLCNSKWLLKHPTVSMVEVHQSDKYRKATEECSRDKHSACQVDKLVEEACRAQMLILYHSQR